MKLRDKKKKKPGKNITASMTCGTILSNQTNMHVFGVPEEKRERIWQKNN